MVAGRSPDRIAIADGVASPMANNLVLFVTAAGAAPAGVAGMPLSLSLKTSVAFPVGWLAVRSADYSARSVINVKPVNRILIRNLLTLNIGIWPHPLVANYPQ